MLAKVIWGILLTAHMVASEDYHDTIGYHGYEDFSKAELKDYLNCLMDKGPCSELDASYKQLYPAFLTELCSRCSKCQKHQLYVLWTRLREELPEDWQVYRAWWDPENKYIDKIFPIIVAEKDVSYC